MAVVTGLSTTVNHILSIQERLHTSEYLIEPSFHPPMASIALRPKFFAKLLNLLSEPEKRNQLVWWMYSIS
jgi:hypothetical protein